MLSEGGLELVVNVNSRETLKKVTIELELIRYKKIELHKYSIKTSEGTKREDKKKAKNKGNEQKAINEYGGINPTM